MWYTRPTDDTPWYKQFVQPGDVRGKVWQKGYKVGAAQELGLPDDAFCGLTGDRWADFWAVWKKQMGTQIPYSTTYSPHKNNFDPNAPVQ